MTLPTGTIALSQVNTELGRSATANINMNDQALRNLAQVGGSGTAYGMNNFRGKSAYTPMTGYGTNDSQGPFGSSIGGGTASAYPSVTVSQGSGGYTYSWSIVSQRGGRNGVLTDSTQPTCRVYYNYGYYEGSWIDVLLQCVITDNTGHTLTISNISGYADWSSQY